MGLPRLHTGQSLVKSELRRFNLLLAGRRWRKTTLGAAYLIYNAWLYGGEYLWGSPTHDQNKIAASYMERILKGKEYKFNRSTMDLEIPANGSLIHLRSLHKPDNARGFTLNGVVIDEAAYINGDAYNEVLRPTLMDTLGWSFMITTPASYNWISDIFNAGNSDSNRVWRIPSYGVAYDENRKLVRKPHRYENPHLKFEELVSLSQTMTEIAFRQEILCEFVSDLLNPFTNIDKLCTLLPLKHFNVRKTVAGLDLAKTVDYSVMSIMNPTTREEIYVEQFPHMDYTLQVHRIVELVRQFNIGMISVDATGVGKAVIEILYPYMAKLNVSVNPVTFNNQIKVDMINNLILAMEQKSVKFTNDDRGIYQFRRFTRQALSTGNIKYEAETGTHDDFVTARSLSYHSCSNVGLFV